MCCHWSLTSRPAPAPNLTRHLVGGGLWGCRSRKEHTRGSFPSMGLFSGRPAIWELADPRSTLRRQAGAIPLCRELSATGAMRPTDGSATYQDLPLEWHVRLGEI